MKIRRLESVTVGMMVEKSVRRAMRAVGHAQLTVIVLDYDINLLNTINITKLISFLNSNIYTPIYNDFTLYAQIDGNFIFTDFKIIDSITLFSDFFGSF